MASPAVPELKRSYAFDYPDIFGMHQKLSAYMNMNDDLRLWLKQMNRVTYPRRMTTYRYGATTDGPSEN